MLAVIGGSGFYNWNLLEGGKEEIIATEYGEAKVVRGNAFGEEIVFLPRHGAGHSIPPHKINYRANIEALRKIGVDKIIALNACGSLVEENAPGTFVLCDDFMDFTSGRISTFHETEGDVKHINVTEPYCNALQKQILDGAKEAGIPVKTGGIYLCTNGPRFETRAEIRFYRQIGATLVGMTGCPEVVLANEAGICYNCLAICTNFGCGMVQDLQQNEVSFCMNESMADIEKILEKVVKNNHSYQEVHCECNNPERFL